MLRSFLIYLSKAGWAQRLVAGWKFAWKAASRFVAGTTVADAITVVHELNDRGINATLDHLGEHTSTAEEAARATEDILTLLDQVNQAGVRANVSIKLTQIGLSLSEELCAQNLENILARARKYNNFVRIDMEDTPYTDATIRQYRTMRQKGYANTGMVIQSYLFRSEKDTRDLLTEGCCFRLVKGAYKEPPDKAYPKKADVDANFDLLTQVMIDSALTTGSRPVSPDGRFPPVTVLGTHDPRRIDFGTSYARKVGLPKGALEVQMLYGIRRDLQEQCLQQGYPVRIYVPYGTHWYPYYMRRLAERPANVWFFLSNFFRR
ncbi:MAG: proline dehydrogenase family protein [Anaerolineales bacterium]|nr:proline dehydrogenase family protein [Anaerolineales bacterium]